MILFACLILAAAPAYDPLALVAPLAVLVAAFVGAFLLFRRCFASPAGGKTTPQPSDDPAVQALREKVRRETGDGGFSS